MCNENFTDEELIKIAVSLHRLKRYDEEKEKLQKIERKMVKIITWIIASAVVICGVIFVYKQLL